MARTIFCKKLKKELQQMKLNSQQAEQEINSLKLSYKQLKEENITLTNQ